MEKSKNAKTKIVFTVVIFLKLKTFFKKLYVFIFGNAIHLGQYIRILYFRKEIKNTRFNVVLDAGCGSGVYTFYLAKRYPQIRIDACDLNENTINSCKKLQKTTSFNNINFGYATNNCIQ